MSKRVVSFCACIFLVGFVGGWALGNSKAIFTHNGHYWQELTDTQKLLYVRGFSMGYQDAVATKEVLAGKSLSDSQRELLSRIDRYLSGKAEGSHKIGEITNAVTTFYADYRNVSVCWEPAVTFSVMSVYGNPPTVEELAHARQGSAKGGCD
jgi:hypothetical protein